MENYPSSTNNNSNHQEIFDPMPIRSCLPNSVQSSSSIITQNVESSFSSVTPIPNKLMYDPKMNRLTAVKRLARNRGKSYPRNRGKSYPKYGPYPCKWCPKLLLTSQSLAGHMRAHYIKVETAARNAAKQSQQQQHLNPEQRQQTRGLANAHANAKARRMKAKAKAEKMVRLVAHVKAEAAKEVTKPRAPTHAASGSGKQPLRTNDCHLRLSNSQFGLIISPGNKNNSVSTESASNAMDFLYSRRRPIISNSLTSADDVLYYHHDLQVPSGLSSRSWSRPSINVNKKPVFVKQEVFPDEDVKPPPGFHHLLSPGSHGRMFIDHQGGESSI